MITIEDDREFKNTVKVQALKMGDTFIFNDNELYIVDECRTNHAVSCTKLGGNNSGKIVQMGNTTQVLQINVRVAITRL